MNETIFIITRHVTQDMKNCDEVWKECYKNIRKFYTNKIIIIDNNSDYDVLKEDILLENCEIIKIHITKIVFIHHFIIYLKSTLIEL